MGGVRGSYNSYTNVMCITEATNNSDSLFTVVLHETIHVIQDCIAGGVQDGNMGSITAYLADGDRSQEKLMDNALLNDLHNRGLLNHAVQAAGGLDHQAAFIEIEAYAFQNDPDAVFTLLISATLSEHYSRLSAAFFFSVLYNYQMTASIPNGFSSDDLEALLAKAQHEVDVPEETQVKGILMVAESHQGEASWKASLKNLDIP